MKGIVMDLNDLSDSRELMETREAPGIRWFILLVLVIFLSGIGFACFSDMDEYVRVRGEVKTANAQGEVVSASNCRISSVNVSEGQQVKAGETLFVLDSEYAKKQKNIIEEQLSSYENDLENTKLLKKSVEENKNLFRNKGDDSKFYYRYEQYSNGVLLTSTEMENKKNDNNRSLEEKQSRLSADKENIFNKKEMLRSYKELLTAIQNDHIYNGSNAEVTAAYNEYVTNSEKASVAAEQYRIAYEDKASRSETGEMVSEAQVEAAKHDAELAQNAVLSCKESYLDDIRTQTILLAASDKEEDKEKLEAYKALKIAIEQDSEFSSELSELNDIYNAFQNTSKTLRSTALSKQETYYTLKNTNAVQSRLATSNEVDSAELAWKNAELDVENVKNSFISKVQNRISTLESEISTLETEEKDIELAMKNTEDLQVYEKLSGDKLKTETIISLDSEIDSLKKSIASAETQLTELDEAISHSEIKANVSGTATLINELNEGDIVQAGENLCTIVPNSGEMKVMLYVPESEVAKLEVGQTTEYTFDSLSSNGCGQVSGIIQSISADSVTDSTTGAKYYIAQADITETEQNDAQGDLSIVRNGMQLNGKVINGSKKTIIWFLEKIHLKEKK